MQVQELTSETELRQRNALLRSRGLSVPACTRAWGITDNNELLATVGVRDGTLVGFAVAESAEGQGLAVPLTERAVADLFLSGTTNIRAFTKITAVPRFKAIGFHAVACTSEVALIEWNDIFSCHLRHLSKLAAHTPRGAASVVLNANPFTLGHLALIKTASDLAPWVWVFVVSEEISEFLFADRLAMVRQALVNFSNVCVLPSGPYMVSLASFPSYFTRETDKVRVHAELDAQLFVQQAKALKIQHRFVGEEPFSKSTREYNKCLQHVLPGAGIKCHEIPRKRLSDTDTVISASAVRKLLFSGKLADALRFLPKCNHSLIASAITRSRHIKEAL